MRGGNGRVAGETQATAGQFPSQQLIHAGFVKRRFALSQRRKATNAQLRADDIVTKIGQATGLNESDVTGTVYGDFHW